jgi:hydrogenase maturation protease
MGSAIVIGVGNPVIADDALGIEVARRLRRQLAGQGDVTVAEVYNGGLELMEAMAGYESAFVVDAIVAGSPPGTIYRLGVDELASTRNSSTTHHGSLSTAMELGRLAGMKLPDVVRVWAVEAGDVTTFCEKLTPAVERAVPVVAAEIMCELFRGSVRPRRFAE